MSLDIMLFKNVTCVKEGLDMFLNCIKVYVVSGVTEYKICK